MTSSQSTNCILMVRSACFHFNRETSSSNAFQDSEYPNLLSPDKIHSRALIEFDVMVEGLPSYSIDTDVFDDTSLLVQPNAIFSDSWLTTHSDEIIIIYVMFAENYRPECRYDLIKK